MTNKIISYERFCSAREAKIEKKEGQAIIIDKELLCIEQELRWIEQEYQVVRETEADWWN